MTWPTFANWGWDFVIQINDDGTTPPWQNAINVGCLEGDLVIVTLEMWMASGNTPTLALGRFGGSFIDQTSDWTALPAVTNGHAYAQSFWRLASADMESDLNVSYSLDNYSVPDDGGIVSVHVFRDCGTPEIVYQQGASGSLDDTPAESADDPIFHTYFGRSAWVSTPSGGVTIQPFGYFGVSGAWFQAQTQAADDNGSLTTHIFTDRYGVGHFFPATSDLPSGGGVYDGHITWDTQTAGTGRVPLGPQTAVIQGIRLPITATNMMMIL